jgi:hypothetical protein
MVLLVELDSGTVVVGDKAYDADWIRAQIKDQGAIRDFERFPKNLDFMVLRPRRRFSSHTVRSSSRSRLVPTTSSSAWTA